VHEGRDGDVRPVRLARPISGMGGKPSAGADPILQQLFFDRSG
jgi:hypothetical protein